MRVLRQFLIIVLIGFLHTPPAIAEEQKLTGDQIFDLLNGNTIRGTWHGREYTQTFYEDGNTSYSEGNNRPSFGKWRANLEENTFESRWGGPSWTGYAIIETDDFYLWKPEVGEPQPFSIK